MGSLEHFVSAVLLAVKLMNSRLIFPCILGLVGVTILGSLGLWQTYRLEWKTKILDEISQKMEATAVALPLYLSEETDEYRKVVVQGEIVEGELHVLTSKRMFGPGFRIIAAIVLEDNRRVLVDRGFVPEAEKNSIRPFGKAKIVGNLLWPNETDSFTPQPDRYDNIWFARDVKLMSDELWTEPVLIVATESSIESKTIMQPVGVNIANDHFEYALTWFGLAFAWFWMTVYMIWRIRRA